MLRPEECRPMALGRGRRWCHQLVLKLTAHFHTYTRKYFNTLFYYQQSRAELLCPVNILTFIVIVIIHRACIQHSLYASHCETHTRTHIIMSASCPRKKKTKKPKNHELQSR